jgi:hypothetical protein
MLFTHLRFTSLLKQKNLLHNQSTKDLSMVSLDEYVQYILAHQRYPKANLVHAK